MPTALLKLLSFWQLAPRGGTAIWSSRISGGPADQASALLAEFESMRSLIGVQDARPHDARHTAATLLLEVVDISVSQEILGDASLAVVRRYAHVRDKLTRDAAEHMGEALWS
ncbi:tyrosine-type recombinase/integrase [Kribbella sp. CA-247076]|uniref:tyrosine-type recombinase/integrase n=1 Tax=Kribbella sp. CA-247076 TaxID=3239941 RepID=UPI003D8AF441